MSCQETFAGAMTADQQAETCSFCVFCVGVVISSHASNEEAMTKMYRAWDVTRKRYSSVPVYILAKLQQLLDGLVDRVSSV